MMAPQLGLTQTHSLSPLLACLMLESTLAMPLLAQLYLATVSQCLITKL